MDKLKFISTTKPKLRVMDPIVLVELRKIHRKHMLFQMDPNVK